jgi:hypothetical protein
MGVAKFISETRYILSCPSVGLHVFIYYSGSRLEMSSNKTRILESLS